MRVHRWERQMAWALTTCALAACATGHPTEAAGEEFVAGAVATVVFDEVVVAGGVGQRSTTMIDSATARYVVMSCRESSLKTSCPAGATREGSALAGTRDRLFDKARSSAFRALRASYVLPEGAIRPPDYAAWSVTVTAGGRRRTVTWERGAQIPSVLASFACTVQVARGDLISCID